MLTDRHREQYEEGNDADFAYTASGVARFRVNVFKDHRGAGAVFRQIPSQILSLEQLGFPPVIQELCNTPRGRRRRSPCSSQSFFVKRSLRTSRGVGSRNVEHFGEHVTGATHLLHRPDRYPAVGFLHGGKVAGDVPPDVEFWVAAAPWPA